MLTSKFEKRGTFRATKIFTDRSEPRLLFKEIMKEFTYQRIRNKILVFYGIGGIGKTELLKELTQDEYYPTTYDCKIKRLYISLDVYDYSNPIPVLINIRKQINEECHLFDYALMTYYNRIGITSSEALAKIGKINPTIFDVISDVISVGLGDITVPIKYLKILADKIYQKKTHSKLREHLEELQSLNEFEIYERLPYYLGLEIRRISYDNNRFILFMDSYESILLKMRDTAVREDSEEWLKELFISSELLLLVVGSREKLKWEEGNEEWKEYLDQHILERLSDEDAKYFLQEVPITEVEVMEAIVSSSNGIPLYLDMCVDLYSNNINGGKINKKEFFNIDTDLIIGRYLRHLTDNEKYLTEVLSLFDYFDFTLVEFLINDLNVSLNTAYLEEYLSKSMFLELDNISNRYKLDDSVRAHINQKVEDGLIIKVNKSLINYLRKNLEISNLYYVNYLEQIMKMSQLLNCNKGITEDILFIINALIDYGNWNEVNLIIDKHNKWLTEYYPEIYYYCKLRFYRRKGMLHDGIKLINDAHFDERLLGTHECFYRFLKVHFIHLTGEYDIAINKYKETIDEYELIKRVVDLDAFMMFKIKYADLLMLKGRFISAKEIIDSILEHPNISNMIIVEALRVKGHILRFNYKFKEAEIVYASILKICGDKNLNVIGKIYNNMLECKCYYEPDEAIAYGLKSKEINESIGASIELGKTLTSLGIAYAIKGDIQKANEAIKKSISVQEESGYLSGVLFGMIAKYLIISGTSGDSDELQNLHNKIIELNKKINVYSFLLLPIELNFEEAINTYEWLDYEAYKAKTGEFIKLLKSSLKDKL